MKTNPEESAYPSRMASGPSCSGLTKRELFAGLALQGLLASYVPYHSEEEPNQNNRRDYEVSWAVSVADALIAELNRENPDNG